MNWFELDLPYKADLGFGRDIAVEDINRTTPRVKSHSVLTSMFKTVVVTKEVCRWVNFFQGFWVYPVVDMVFLKRYGGFWTDVFRYHPGM
tara:strand:- start:446 stop:715 length:270 start_codon:yes stop_codon:yes gene_type:complete